MKWNLLTTMTKQQWNSPLRITPLMHKMHIYLPKPLNFNPCLEMIQFVQLRFLLAPIKPFLPILCQSLDISSGLSIS